MAAPPVFSPARRAWLQATLPFAVIGALVWQVGTGPFLAGFGRVGAASLAAAAGVGAVATVCCAWRWRLVAGQLGVDLPLRSAVVAYYRSQFINVATPGGMLGDVHRALGHGRTVGDTSHALRSVVGERFAGQLVLFAMAGLAMAVAPVGSPMSARVAGILVILAVVTLVVVLGASQPPRALRVRWTRLAGLGEAGRLTSAAPYAWAGIVLASVVAVAGHVVTFLIAARTSGSQAPAQQVLPIALVVLVGAGLPNIAGWGPREGVAAWAFGFGGLGADEGVSTAVAYGVMTFVATLPGAVVVLAHAASAVRRPAPGQGPSRSRRR